MLVGEFFAVARHDRALFRIPKSNIQEFLCFLAFVNKILRDDHIDFVGEECAVNTTDAGRIAQSLLGAGLFPAKSKRQATADFADI